MNDPTVTTRTDGLPLDELPPMQKRPDRKDPPMKNAPAQPPRDTTLPDGHHSTTGRAARQYTGNLSQSERSERIDLSRLPIQLVRAIAALVFGGISAGIVWVMALTGEFDWGLAITAGWFGAIAGYGIRAIRTDH